jgi:ubiquinone/menaquinone biosynthesis C-methylase UbiE
MIVMNSLESTDVEKTLNKPDIHQQWGDSYVTAKKFYEQAFDYIKSVINAPKNSTFLDVGCGTGGHSIRLAKRGFSVVAIDFSDHILKTAELNVRSEGLQDNIKLQYGNILSLPFATGTFDHVLCWGVLMHIPDVEKAISELGRVLKRGGILVVSEGNMYSLQSIIHTNLKAILRKERATVKKTAAGIEYWALTSAGKLLTRESNIGWLKKELKRSGFIINKHVPGQFTEFYARSAFRRFRKPIHDINYLWFKYIKIPHLAFGNILIAQKQG